MPAFTYRDLPNLWGWMKVTSTKAVSPAFSEHYGEDAFSVIIIDECHRSAWGRWSEVLRRNANAIHIGLTATPRKLEESRHATPEDQEITANNHEYFGEPVYEYTLIQAQEDGYLAACEIVKRKASIDSATFTQGRTRGRCARYQDRQATHRG
jgi:type I site-specific restriction endonuclease